MKTVKWNLFILNTDWSDLKAGTILLRGYTTSEDGTEYFDISREMAISHSYSYYDVPSRFLDHADNETVMDVDKFFKNTFE
jgi:hypothetical protein